MPRAPTSPRPRNPLYRRPLDARPGRVRPPSTAALPLGEEEVRATARRGRRHRRRNHRLQHGHAARRVADGTPFEGNRYVDRYVVRHGKIVQMEVWNDSAEWLLVRAGLATLEADAAESVQRALTEHGRFRIRPITRRPDYRLAGRRAAGGLPRLQHRALRFRRRARRGARPESPAARRAELFAGANTATASARGAAWSCSTSSAAGGRAHQHRALRPLPGAGRGMREARRRDRRPRPHQRRAPGRDEPKPTSASCSRSCRDRIAKESGVTPRGWLSPWISESAVTPDLLAETGYRYTLNWCHDDQPVPHAHARAASRCGRSRIRRS